jgi:uncharacterized peroxidase-related enzyme
MAISLQRPKHDTSTNGDARRVAWITPPDEASLPEEVRALFARQRERNGAVHNSALVAAHNPAVLLAQSAFSGALFDPEGGSLTPRERELIAVVVSAENRCEPCTVGHTAKLRQLTGDANWVDTLAINYRRARLNARDRALADFALRITRASAEIEEADLAQLRAVGLDDAAIVEAATVAAYFNFSNRLTSALGVRPHAETFAAFR